MNTVIAKSVRDEQADKTRGAILSAARSEFHRRGFEGASTVSIMKAANANQSLLYYYFKNKKGIYQAVIEDAIETYAESSAAILASANSAGERLLRAALIHFDRYVTDFEAQRLLQQELIRLWSGSRDLASLISENLFKPWLGKMEATIREGIESGELRRMHWRQAIFAILGMNGYYFLNAHLIGLTWDFDPFSHVALDSQRTVMAHYMGATMFEDPAVGKKVADLVLRDLPMPKQKIVHAWKEA
jgi:AcrR family transcriptional regulator